ncbi:MAG: DNA translocase FtsK 4TM domain-containing protein, partial [Myxococcota bacterium]|nr:DNA translocase FtsK 4TM domain-containing protein [Myxococcota bacterium]
MAKAKETAIPSTADNIEMPKGVVDGVDEAEAPARRFEVMGVVLFLVAVFLLLSLASYSGMAQESQSNAAQNNLMGIAGEWTAYVAFTMIGLTAYLLDAMLWISAVCLFRSRVEGIRPRNILGIFFIVVFTCVALHTALQGDAVLGGHAPGGFLGALFGEFLLSIVSVAGTYLIAFGGIVIVLLLITDISLALLFRWIALATVAAGRGMAGIGVRFFRAWQQREDDPSDLCETPMTAKTDIDLISAEPNPKDSATDIKIVKSKPSAKKKKKKTERPDALDIDRSPLEGKFQLPALEFLKSPPDDSENADIDEQHLRTTADHLVKILSDFGVLGEVHEIHPGPVVTMFEFQPKSGTKLSKIEGLSNEIAMALEVLRVRVVAPIPGKNAVGFELPNRERETVYLREMISDDGFTNRKQKLPLSLGKDISGRPCFVDLSKMPHLLIAGTTGSGKSVSLNAMLLSLLYKYTPDDLRLLLVDPKMIELGVYDGIPHLLLPVVTDMSKACLALKWAVDEMERRYQLFADLGVRNLASYNAKIEKLKANAKENSGTQEPVQSSYSVEDDEVVVVSEASDSPEKLEKLPFIVTVVDELADLMMVAAKDVEISIARLAQKARAAGLHLIIATQRPSVDVITGLIKANFPSRISFRVSSGHDSRTILGTQGAENLLGMGDMLIIPPGTSD